MDGTVGILTGRGPTIDELDAWLDTLPRSVARQRLPGNQIAYQRNQLAAHFEGAWLLFVDHDCVPPRGALDRLLSHNLPIVSAAVVERVAPFHLCAVKRFEPYERYTPADLASLTEPIPVPSVGAGCLLIRRPVFERLRPPWFRCGQLAPDLLSEDLDFCLRAQEQGFAVYLDPQVRCGHATDVLLWPGDDGQVWAQWPGPAGRLPYREPLGVEFVSGVHL